MVAQLVIDGQLECFTKLAYNPAPMMESNAMTQQNNTALSQTVSCPVCDHEHTVEMEHVERCNLCGASDEEYLFTRGDLALGLGGEFKIVRCRSCGLIYMNPRPTVAAIGYYYPGAYECFNLPDVDSGRTRYARWSRSQHLNLRCKMVVKYKLAGRLLDVGCSDGRFLHQMRLFGAWQRQGVELMDEAAEQGRQRYKLNITTGTLEEADLPVGAFDVVSMWDVLEHVHDPKRVLSRAAELLKPGGILLFSIPILDSLGGRVFGQYWVGYELPRHLHIFSRKTLGRYLQKCGFELVEEKNLYGSNYAFADNTRFWLRGHGAPRTVYGAVHWFLRSRPWRFITAPLFKLLDILHLATPLTVVCRRVR